jgi:hypothetical protein
VAQVNVSLDPAASSVAFLALLATVALGIGQLRLQRRMTALEEGRHEDERRRLQKAEVVAQFYRKREADPFFPTFWVTLKNTGAAPAHDVTVSISNADKHLRPGVTVDPGALPIPWLHAGQSVSIQLDVIPGAQPPSDVVVAWVDGQGPQERPVRATWL